MVGRSKHSARRRKPPPVHSSPWSSTSPRCRKTSCCCTSSCASSSSDWRSRSTSARACSTSSPPCNACSSGARASRSPPTSWRCGLRDSRRAARGRRRARWRSTHPRGASARCAAPARAPAARGGAPRPRRLHLPGLWRGARAHRRGEERAARLAPGDLLRASAHSPEVCLPGLRDDHHRAGTRRPHRQGAPRARAARPRAHQQVPRPSAALPPGGDLRALRGAARAQHPGRLGRREHLAARPPRRAPPGPGARQPGGAHR
jgi:hypothetical protein